MTATAGRELGKGAIMSDQGAKYKQVAAFVVVGLAGMFLGLASAKAADPGSVVSPDLSAGQQQAWRFARGDWTLAEGVLEQRSVDGASVAVLKEPAFADSTLSVEFNVRPEGSGVRAAAIVFRATGTLTYYWLHLDSKNQQVILVRSEPKESWHEIGRRRCSLADDVWQTAQVDCRGSSIRICVDGQEVLAATDPTLPAGRIGFGTSQGHVQYRHLRIAGAVSEQSEPLHDEEPPPPLYKIISRGEAAGPYQAFPDVCRLANGDLACVFYAGFRTASATPRPRRKSLTGGILRSPECTRSGWTACDVLASNLASLGGALPSCPISRTLAAF